MTEIAKEYGTALFMLALEADKKKEYAEALDTVLEVFCEKPEYSGIISSPAISLEERLKVIEEAFSAYIPEDVLSYLKLLCEKGRIFCFADSVKEYMLLLEESQRVAKAKITTAVEMTDDEKQKLLKKLESISKKTVEPEYYIDKSLLGGVVIELEGRVIDSSLKTQLRDIKEVIKK